MRSPFLGPINESPIGQPSLVASGMEISGSPSIGAIQESRNVFSRKVGAAMSPIPFFGAIVGTVGSMNTVSLASRFAALSWMAARNARAAVVSAVAAGPA